MIQGYAKDVLNNLQIHAKVPLFYITQYTTTIRYRYINVRHVIHIIMFLHYTVLIKQTPNR